MTLRQFFLEYLWPLDTYSISTSTANRQGIDLNEDVPDSERREVSTNGVGLHLQIQLRSNLQTYVRRWFMVSVGLFAMAWASSLVLTMLGSLAAMVGVGLLGVRHYVDRKDTAGKTSDAVYRRFRKSASDESAGIHSNNLH